MAQACPSVTQVGRMAQYLCAQAQHPQHHQHPLAEHFYDAAYIQAWVRWRLLAQVWTASLWTELFSTPAVWEVHGKIHTVSRTIILEISVPSQIKAYYNPWDSFREQNTAWKSGQEVASSLPSFLLAQSLSTLGLSTDDIKTHWAKPAPSPNSLYFTVLILLF